MKKIGYIYNFFPVEFENNDEVDGEVITLDDSWQWKYFPWLFWIIFYSRSFVATLMDEDDYFVIKLKNK